MRLRRPSWGDVGTWLLAFLLAVGLWFFVNAGARTSERSLSVRLDLVDLPGGFVITSAVPETVDVRISGTGLMLSSIDSVGLSTSLDLAGVQPGVATYGLSAKDFALPRGVEINRITPSRISLRIDRVVRERVGVELDYRGELGRGLQVVEIQILPAQVDVTGPRAQVSPLTEVVTQAIDRSTLEPGVNERELALLGPGGLVQLRRTNVSARLVVERALTERVYEDVSVDLKSAQGWEVIPSAVRIVVRGPVGDEIEELGLAEGAAYVDASMLSAGEAIEVSPLVTLPPGFEVVRLEPATVRLEPLRRDASGAVLGELEPDAGAADIVKVDPAELEETP